MKNLGCVVFAGMGMCKFWVFFMSSMIRLCEKFSFFVLFDDMGTIEGNFVLADLCMS